MLRLVHLHGAAARRPEPTRLKVTRRVWVHEWTWPAPEGETRVTARVADRRIEELVVAGAP